MRLISLLFLANHCDGFYVASNIQQSRSVLSTLIRSVPNDFSGRHSFVEGDRYDGKLEEIEAMGGDPFFLDNEVELNKENKDIQNEKEETQALEFSSLLALANKASSTNGKGPPQVTKMEVNNVQEHVRDWEWDGIVDEEAHLGFD